MTRRSLGWGLRRPESPQKFRSDAASPSRLDAAGGKAGDKWDLLRRIAKKSVCLPRPVAFAQESPYNNRDLHKGGRSFSAWFLSTPTASGQARLFRCGFIFPPSCLNAPFSWAQARFSDASGFFPVNIPDQHSRRHLTLNHLMSMVAGRCVIDGKARARSPTGQIDRSAAEDTDRRSRSVRSRSVRSKKMKQGRRNRAGQ